MAQSEPFDVIIVGSGAGGGMSAYSLTHAGLKVLMLEAGRHYDPLTETPMFNIPAQAPLRGLLSQTRQVFGIDEASSGMCLYVQVRRSIAFCSIAGRQFAVGQVGGGIAAQRERCGWDTGRGYVQGQPGISRGPLSIHPGRIEAGLGNSEYRSRVARVKIGHRTPYIGAWTAVI